MNKKKTAIIIGAICLLLLVLAIIFGVILLAPAQDTPATQPTGQTQDTTATPSQEETKQPSAPTTAETTAPTEETSTKPTQETEGAKETEPSGATEPSGTTEPTQPPAPTTPTEPEKTPPPTEDTPPEVEIPTEEEGVAFPCEVPGHDLLIERLEPYSGLFVEDGTNQQVADVAMILVSNIGTTAVEYTEITVEYQDKTLTFQITALPAGEKMVVQEKSANTIPDGTPLRASALVVHRAQMEIAPEISVTDNGDNSLTVTNLTGETLSTVRVFYKYYMKEENLFVGGIAFTVRITNLAPNGSVVVQPAHYTSQTSKVVMAQVYETES